MSYFDLGDYELGWLVGILEGEGWFRFGAQPRNGTIIYNWGICITSTDKDVIEHVAQIFGTKVSGPRYERNPDRPLWHTGLWIRARVIELCSLLHPHMSLRRQQQIAGLLEQHELHPPRKAVPAKFR